MSDLVPKLEVAANRAARKWSRSELVGRLLWDLAHPLFVLSPRPMWGWRRFLLRLFGARIGRDVHVFPSALITIPWNISIGDQSAVGDRAILYALGSITIGRQVTISQGAHLCAGSHDYTRADLPLTKPPIRVGDGAWVCADAFVGPDVEVGAFAIVAAGAVVMRSCEGGAIVAGNPARKVKDRAVPLSAHAAQVQWWSCNDQLRVGRSTSVPPATNRLIMTDRNIEYHYDSANETDAHKVLHPALVGIVREFKPKRVFDLGCGNGTTANLLSGEVETVVGIDASVSAIRHANQAFPKLRIEIGSAYDDLAAKYGTYDMVISLEVVEHLYDPRAYARNLLNLLRPGGVAVVSTPYHGYWKNLALAATGKMDAHFWALWDGGHIKFWSIRTLTTLLHEQGFDIVRFDRVGRIPPLAKSMIAIARRPPG